MNRRELLATSIGAGVLVVAGASRAQTKPASKPADARGELLAALAECQRTGEECVAHCAEELGRGNKEMARCNRSVLEMLAMTRALLALAAMGSPRARPLAALCAATCADCRDACAEHRDHFAHGMHLACKACMEACERCAKACKAFA
jgi:Cys-rich four helix bundle protein (predicted Tat secretion target)